MVKPVICTELQKPSASHPSSFPQEEKQYASEKIIKESIKKFGLLWTTFLQELSLLLALVQSA